eukprot:gene35683-46287_t
MRNHISKRRNCEEKDDQGKALTGSYDLKAKFWGIPSGHTLAILSGHPAELQLIALFFGPLIMAIPKDCGCSVRLDSDSSSDFLRTSQLTRWIWKSEADQYNSCGPRNVLVEMIAKLL